MLAHTAGMVKFTLLWSEACWTLPAARPLKALIAFLSSSFIVFRFEVTVWLIEMTFWFENIRFRPWEQQQDKNNDVIKANKNQSTYKSER